MNSESTSKAKSNRRWRLANPDKAKAAAKRNYEKRKTVWNKNQLFYRYGLTREMYEDMLRAQDGKCVVCRKVFGEDKENKPHVDHSHKTKKVRALLCNKCNRGLGQFLDDPELLRKAADYLERHQ